MWLVSKGASSAESGEPVDPAIAATLRIWYQGQGDHIDEQHALVLVRHARKTRQWLACDCRGSASTPMLSPALLTEADTYYLRRLTGRSRVEHIASCPFYRAQVLATATKSDRSPARGIPDGYFTVLKPAPLALAQAPDADTPTRDSASHGTPRLAKLLWRLLEVSGRTTIPATEKHERTIAAEFDAIRRAAEHIEVAPGIALARVLFTHPRDWTSNRAFAVLRELSAKWPRSHEPQAFLLIYTRTIHEQSIETSEGDIDIATRVRHPGTRATPIAGPYLVLIAIGNHPDVRGYAAQRAWAQPIHNGHRFVPVEDNFDRGVADALIAARRIMAKDGIAINAQKPMFDLMTPDGLVRPHWTVTMRTPERTLPIVISTREYDDGDPVRHSLGFLGSPVFVNRDNIERLTLTLKRTWQEQSDSAG